MPKQDKTAVSTREVMTPISRPEEQEVNARQVDFHNGVSVSPELDGLVKGLKQIQPKLNEFALFHGRKVAREDLQAGSAAAKRNEELAEDASRFFRQGYMNQRGLVEGEKFGGELLQKYNTEFNKDSGDIEKFIKENTQAEVEGLDDEDYGRGFGSNQGKYLDHIRTEQFKYQQIKITETVESDAMARLETAYDTRKSIGQPLNVNDLEQLRKELGQSFGVSNTRFNDLVFDVINKKGMAGDFAAYDLLKKNRPDGTKGMYHIPKWKAKIDKAQLASQNTYLAAENAQDKRDDKARNSKQDEAMFGILLQAESDPEAAALAFDKLITDGLFEDATQYVKYKKLLTDVIDDEDGSPEQAANEAMLTSKILSNPNSVTFGQLANFDLAPKQQVRLAGLIRSQRGEARTATNDGASKSKKIYSSYQYTTAKDWIKDSLKPLKSEFKDFSDNDKTDTHIMNTMMTDFDYAIEGITDPKELKAIAAETIERGKRLKEDRKLLKKNKNISLIRYPTPLELDNAVQAGLVTDMNVINAHIDFFQAKIVKQAEKESAGVKAKLKAAKAALDGN